MMEPSSSRKGINLAENNGVWAGDSVGYGALHAWIKRRLFKPNVCQSCRTVPPYDLANKGTYDRDLQNWEWLCRSCHMAKDGRAQKLVQAGRGGRKGKIYATHCPKGHEYTTDNVYAIIQRGHLHRQCKTCNRIRALKNYYKKLERVDKI